LYGEVNHNSSAIQPVAQVLYAVPAYDSKKGRDVKRKMKKESDREKSEKNNEQIKIIILSVPILQGGTLSNKHIQCHVLT
jgi:hypothetical protein